MGLIVAIALGILAFGIYQQSEVNLSLAHVRGTTASDNPTTSAANAVTAIYESGLKRSAALSSQSHVAVNTNNAQRGLHYAEEVLDLYPYTPNAEQALVSAATNNRSQRCFSYGYREAYSGHGS
jgi:hypothetical protein